MMPHSTTSVMSNGHDNLPGEDLGNGGTAPRKGRAASDTTQTRSTAYDHLHTDPSTELSSSSSGAFRIPAIPARMCRIKEPLKNAPKNITRITSSEAARRTHPSARENEISSNTTITRLINSTRQSDTIASSAILASAAREDSRKRS